MKTKKLVRWARKGKVIRQVAARAYRIAEGELEILLLTSRDTGRYVVPKGWPKKKLENCDAAVREASEEAGVFGRLAKVPIAQYSYFKRLDENFVHVIVEVYPLHVEKTLEQWKERKQRKRAWLKPGDAALLVDEPGLVSILAAISTVPPRL